MKIVEWWRFDAAFKLRMAYLGEKLTYEERLQRVEELLWLRDEVKSMIEEKEYAEPASVYDSTKATQATANSGQTELVSVEGPEWCGEETPLSGTHPFCCGGCGQGRECDTKEAREKRDVL